MTSARIGYFAALFLAATCLVSAVSKLRDVTATARKTVYRRLALTS